MRYFKPYLIAAVFLIILDPLLSISSHMLSGNIRHIEQIPEIVQRIKYSELPSILLLGNSLTNNGFKVNYVERKIEKIGSKYQIEKLTPDGTDLWEWSFIVQNHILDKNVHPGIIVIGFAWDILSDKRPPNPSRLGAHFCDFNDLYFINRYYPLTISQNIEFLLSKISFLYGNRDIISKRLLDRVIPAYQENTRLINEHFNNKRNDNRDPVNTYARLKLFVEGLKQEQINVLFVAMPVLDKYDIDPKLVSNLIASGGHFLDARNIRGILPSSFEDTIHLNEKGSAILSGALLDYLDSNGLL